jgi:SP family sugar:H+ symporter-like MFS transporter
MPLLNLRARRLNADNLFQTTPNGHTSALQDASLIDTPIPLLTWRSFVMGIFVSMGGFTFGYDTGQISGFLEMDNFLERYGQQKDDGTCYFSNIRSGLIVGLVGSSPNCPREVF